MGILDGMRATARRLFLAEPGRVLSRIGLTREVGSTGTKNYSGFIEQDLNSLFNGMKSVDVYEEMRRTDATVAATLNALKLPIMEAERQIVSADQKDKTAEEIATFVRKNLLENLEGGFTSALRFGLTYLDFGYSYMEKVYELRDGKLMLKKLAGRMQSAHYRWIMSDKEVPGVTQLLPTVPPNENDSNTIREIPFSKLLLFVNGQEGDNFEGISILRTAYKHWYYKDMFYRIDGIRQERGAGVLVITRPAGSSAADASKAEELGESFKLNSKSFISLPNPDWKVDLLTKGIESQGGNLIESVKHHDREITLNILAQFLDLGSSTGGSYALAENQTDFFSLSLRSIASYVAERINTQVIRELVDLNFGKQESYPKLMFTKIGNVDMEKFANALSTLSTAGLIDVDNQMKSYVAKTLKLPQKTEEEMAKAEDAKRDNKTEEDDEKKKNKVEDEDEDVDGDGMENKLAEKKINRPLTEAEGRVKFAQVAKFFDESEDELEEQIDELTAQQRVDILKKIEKGIDLEDIAVIIGLSLIGSAAMRAHVANATKTSLEAGKASAANEIGVSIPTTTNFTKNVVAAKIDLAMKAREQAILDNIKARAVDMVNNEVGKQAILNEVERIFDNNATAANARIVGHTVVDSYNEGRALSFQKSKEDIHGLQRSEILDEVTCEMCVSLDGRVVSVNDPFTQLGQVHNNCRGIWVAIIKTDNDLPEVKNLPKSILNRFDSVDGVPNVDAFRQLKKPIITKDSRARQKIEDGIIDM